MKRLIVNADDFGQSDGINKGIFQGFEKGIVTSASLMVRYPAATGAAGYAKRNGKLGVGLHLDLGEWIFRDGEWKTLYTVVDLNNTDDLKKEIRNQIEMFNRVMDKQPTHIDSHQHVHLRNGVREIVMQVAENLNVIVRGCNDKVKYCGDFYGQLEDGSPYHNAISVDALKKIILNIRDGITELACHPGLDEDIQTMYIKERDIELQTLCDKSIRELLNTRGIELCSFADV